MPPRGRLQVGSNIGLDKERAYREKIDDLLKHQVREIPLLLIDEGENIRQSYDEEGIKQLALSITEHGLLQPVLLNEKGTRFGIRAGHRRVLAFRLLRRETIPAIVGPPPEHLDELQLIENIQREDLSPADLESAVSTLVKRAGSQEKVAERLMKSKQWVSNILAASKVREAIGDTLEGQGVRSSLPSGHLREIAGLPKDDQASAAKEGIRCGGGKRAFRAAAKKAKLEGSTPRTSPKPGCLFTATLSVLRQSDGTLAYQPKLDGNVPSKAKTAFADFCEAVKRIIGDP